MYLPASDVNRMAAPFKSSSPPTRRSGALVSISFPTSAMAIVIFVGKNPGAMSLTVMLNSPHSPASARVKYISPMPEKE